MMRAPIVCALAAMALTAGCASNGSDTYPAPLAPIGEVRGTRVGVQIGKDLDPEDLRAARAAEYQALEYSRADKPLAWKSDRSDLHGVISLGRGYQVNRLDCREYTNTLYVGGRAQVARGVACRQPAGTWRIVD